MEPCQVCREKTVRQKAVIDYTIFYECPSCGCIFRQRSSFPTPLEERNRYLLHENDVADIGYQEFVKPLITKVCEDFEGSARGLDYGAGTGPVAAMLLQAAGYTMQLYDPFFHNHPEVLKETYNFAICCEVIEHFHQPLKEFRALHTYLLPGGVLYCMTDLIDNQREFEQWHYKNDPTHVVFYSEKTLLWIAREIGFSCCEITERVIKLAKS